MWPIYLRVAIQGMLTGLPTLAKTCEDSLSIVEISRSIALNRSCYRFEVSAAAFSTRSARSSWSIPSSRMIDASCAGVG